MFGCQQNLISPNKEVKAILESLCSESSKLTNCGFYYARQMYFKTGKIPIKADLQHKVLGTENRNLHHKAFYSDTAQQILTTVAESFKSYIRLLRRIIKGTVTQRPRLPNYRQGGLARVTYTSRSVRLKDGLLRFPLGSKVKTWFGLDAFYLPMPTNLDYKAIREYRILPRNGSFYLEVIYTSKDIQVEVDQSKALMRNHGMNNWLTCVSNEETSLIIDGRHLKSINQGYNKLVAFLTKGKANSYWSKRLDRLTESRNRTMRDAVNKAARKVINHCWVNKIGTVIFGWNAGMKNGINLASQTHQNLVQIPTGRLKGRIAQLCEQYGIRFIETEESYTSKASFVDLDVLPKFREKPEGWQPSGQRVKRGLYPTLEGLLINCDCNGAANIGRKVAATLGLCLMGVSRGDLITPLKVPLWT